MTAARETFAYLRPFQLQPVKVKGCVETALQRVTQAPQVRIRATGLAKLPPVLAGEEQLRLVLYNLVENAVEALGEAPGKITITGRVVQDALDPDRAWVEVAIADTGPGVAPAVRERIFDATFSTGSLGRKMGFGLWWVKSWVQRFGGSIRLADARPHTPGCTFIVRLPVAGAGGPAPHEA